MKATAIANSNIALVKYWGKSNTELFLPTRPNLSINLGALNSKTTVKFSKDFDQDTFILNGKETEGKIKEKAIRGLNVIRNFSKTDSRAKVVSENNFPTGAGIASSASGFAALTVAATNALGLNLDKKTLSTLSRQGSGSSCRSIHGGFVEWIKSDTHEGSYANQVHDEKYWDLIDLIAVTQPEEKKISSRAGMAESMKTSPYYKEFVRMGETNIQKLKEALRNRDFDTLGKITELDCMLMHCVMQTTTPMLLYWSPETVKIMKSVISWREEGLKAYFTIDAGPNVQVITLPEFSDEIEKRLKEISGVESVLKSGVGGDAKTIDNHLF